MEQLALIALVAVSNWVCFWLGSRTGRAEAVKETKQAPPKERDPDPVTKHRRKEQEKREQLEQERRRVVLENIENYDGTAYGQQDVPGRY
jgi:hypothetical protein